MSLYMINRIENPMTYDLWPGFVPDHDPEWVWDKYNPYLRTPPRIYTESMVELSGFFYVPPPRDIYVLWMWGAQTLWPSWYVNAFHFDAGTGLLKERITGESIFISHYTNSMELCDLQHMFVTRNETTDCFQMNWLTGARESSAWIIDPYNNWPVEKREIFSHLLVNKQADRILGAQYPYIKVFENVLSNDPTLVWSQRIPETIADIAYESNEYGWLLTTDGQIIKFDWGNKFRVEMASAIQSYNPTDRDMALAYDQQRRRLAVYRWMPDAEDGAARNCIEFYETVPRPTYITEPVPVTRHRVGDYVKFKANILGDLGEGFAGGIGTVSLVSPNNHGKVLSTSPISGIVGDLNISYQAPAEPCQETMQLIFEHHDDISQE